MNSLIQYKKFPSSRYMGSKNKIIKNLYEVFNNYKFDSVLDLFSGSASVSYLLKSMLTISNQLAQQSHSPLSTRYHLS